MINRRGRKAYTFTMAMPDMIWAGVGAAFALTVFFLFGVLVGRGYVAVEAVPEPVEVSTHGQSLEALPAPVLEVLKPEDLAYQDQLETTGDLGTATAPEEGAAAVSQGSAQPDEVSSAPVDAPTQDAAQALPEPEPGQAVFNYVYQAAAFRDEVAAHALADKLRERNLEVKVAVGKSASATWYRVQLPFTGTPSQTRPLRELAQEVTGEKPVMVSKKVAD